MSSNESSSDNTTRLGEWKTFIFIIVFLFPILSVIFFGGYGFIVWMMQLLMGPPGHG